MLREQPVRAAAPDAGAAAGRGRVRAAGDHEPAVLPVHLHLRVPRTGQGFSGAGGASFATILVPGLVAVAIFFEVAAVALPLAMELGGTREIEDRLMAPVPVALVAIEKILFSALLSVLSAAMVFPAGLAPARGPGRGQRGQLAAAAGRGLPGQPGRGRARAVPRHLGPAPPDRADVLPGGDPDHLPGLRLPVGAPGRRPLAAVGGAADPLVYVSEGLRAALTPEVGHMPAPAFLGAIGLSLVVLTWAGVKGFLRRTIS